MKLPSLFLFLFAFSSLLTAQRNVTQTVDKPSPETMKAGAFIDVNTPAYPQSNYSITQLIKDVLIKGGSTCTNNVSNVVVSPNLAVNNVGRSWGYFNKGTTAFPFNDGIVLTTGNAQSTGNSYDSSVLSSTLTTNGDADLATALNISNNDLNDATFIEFDFIPSNNTITFKYIFASEEYDLDFPCSFTDGFALLLKKAGDPAYTNLAVLPGGAGPVSVTNIHPAITGQATNCAAKNPIYFAGYNTTNIQTNFRGRTIPLTATATVIPGQTYHFKMVLADFLDRKYNSGVFLQAGSFDIGVQLSTPNGAVLPASTSICQGSSLQINTNSQAAGSTYQWYLNGNPIQGATGSSYTVTAAGTYSVAVTAPGNNCPGTAQIVVAVDPLPVVQNTSLSVCSTSNTATFNLTSAQNAISTVPGLIFTYYSNLTDAQAANNNTIATPTAFVSGNATIYAVVNNGTCKNIANVTLNVVPTPVSQITASAPTICFGGNVILTSNIATGNVWSTGETTQSITVTNAGTYTVTTTVANCTGSPASITLTKETDPNLQIAGSLLLCDTPNILTASANGTGNIYTWSTGATGSTLSVSTAGTYTVNVKTPANCEYTKSVTVTQGVVPSVQNTSLSVCSSANTAVFNLNSAQANISTTAGVTFDFYANQADAIAGNANTIAAPATYTSGNTVIYVKVKSATCSKIAELQLVVAQQSVITVTGTSPTICFGGSVVLTSSSTTGNVWSTGETTQSITVTNAGTYTVTASSGNCVSAPASFTLTKESDPNVQIAGVLVLCDSPNILTASSTGTGNTYLWSNGATSNTASVSTAGIYTVTVTTPANCSYTKSVTVTQGVVPVVQNSSLSVCSTTTTGVFNLNSAQTAISTTAGVTFDYYSNQADAIAGNANTIASPGAYTSGNTVIYVRVKSATCFKIAQLQLTVASQAVATITSSSPTICFGGSVVLTSSSSTGNVWSTGAITQSITVNNAGTYTVTVTTGNCSSAPASIVITKESDPNVQIGGNLILCDVPNILTASANGSGNSYLWSNGSTANTLTVSTAGNYTVTVTTPANCQYTKSVTVTQGTVPVVQNSSLSVCSATATALFNLTSAQSNISTTSGVTFDYYLNQADAIAGNANTITTPAAFTSASTIIYVRVKSSTCSKIVQLQVTVNQIPTPVITASSPTICFGGSVTLTSNITTGNTWSTGATTQSITVTNAGTYTLTYSNNVCTSQPASITLTKESDPNVQITGNLMFCQGSSTVLTATANGTGNTYSWSNGGTTGSTTVTTAGVYTVTVTTSAGCQYQKSVTVQADPLITVNITPTNQIITCNNPQITLNASTSVYQPGATFQWTSTNGGVIVSGANTLTPVISNGGTYTLTITSATPLGCVKQASITILKDTNPPVLTLIAPATKICLGQSINLTASGAATYTWTGLPGNGATQTVSPTTTTTYTVTGIGANGCAATTPATLTITVVPEIESTLKNVEICKGDIGILDAGAGPNYTYLWNTGETSQTISVQTAGNYSVTINNTVCTKVFQAVVSYILVPVIKEVIYKDNTLTINATNNGSIPLEYSIDGGVSWQGSNVFTHVLKNSLYDIRVRNRSSSCTASISYYTFFMTNAITPNNDGINDVIDFTEISKYGNFEGNIFDKYGKSLFKPSVKTPVWDGKYIGRPLPTDTYWYRLFWKDKVTGNPVEISGWILLKNRD
ncbi:choice-of-anchor L domain-containing protein [Chryseobacterium caseinilyticum]|uniref:Choice-of-anchor L domain-containing protein n=1 Tax=Chryseobacterium caseinilyticum TaxID=2771428 RepID=A0ABR8ZGP7_9FLAO|nr:choice-of-anchor L domain-containing protein [Chryseobacterium caseinilyticum]MBD8084481.1 choice-of-anchor L domain-containing protein [Chryseobacterium caseinilyticum]